MRVESLSLRDLAAGLDRGDFSAVELAQELLGRIQSNGLNAFIDVRPDLTLAQAGEADRRRAGGERGPLLGVPVAHKDIFVTRGWRSTAGSRMLADYVSPFDATVVERLAAAGAVCLGKTNCDEFAMGSSNENSHFGAARNPWDPSAIPGGSSGGSAARSRPTSRPRPPGPTPAARCASRRRCAASRASSPPTAACRAYGMIAFASSLDQAGAMGRSARPTARCCCRRWRASIARDSTSVDRPPEDFAAQLERPLAGLRIGVPREFFGEGLAADVRVAIDAALAVLEREGARLVEVSLPRTSLSIPAYYVIAPAEASSNLSRFDGVRYGYRAAQYGDLLDMYEKTRSQGFGAEVKRRILVGTYVLSHGYYDAYYLQAQKLRRLIAQDFRQRLRAGRPDRRPGVADGGLEHRRALRRPGAQLPGRHLHLAGVARRAARHVGAGGLRRGRPPGRAAADRRLFHRGETARRGASVPAVTDWHTRRPPAADAAGPAGAAA